MSARLRGITGGTIAIIAAIVLIPALALDLGVVHHRMREVRTLTADCERLQAQLGQLRASEAENGLLTKFMRAGAQEASLSTENAVRYIGDAVSEAGLNRLELSGRGDGKPISVGRLKKQTYFLRVMGSYARILAFVRRLESDPGLVAIEGLTIVPVVDSDQLEGRMDIAVYKFQP